MHRRPLHPVSRRQSTGAACVYEQAHESFRVQGWNVNGHQPAGFLPSQTRTCETYLDPLKKIQPMMGIKFCSNSNSSG